MLKKVIVMGLCIVLSTGCAYGTQSKGARFVTTF